MPASHTSHTSLTSRPVPLLVGLAGAAAEVVALVGAAVWMLVDRPEGGADSLPYGIAMAVTLLLFAGLVGLGVRGLWRGHRWGRGPVVTWQLLQGITVATMWGLLPAAVAATALALSVVVLVTLLTPAALAATARTLGPAAGSRD
ncbi:hypothetical protein [Pseudactinotalea sp. HY158]|uniref:hypothetical protein n=1 Tax=Pseudactinotalea sp. HY158 TaxID=2654547 RepID=UPI00129CBD24|nr:hypothetical protein [Pseudactinotalea sp. HY158]QGH70242.1 hypothetical protein GCE65_12575 [Pseudactinotalea sp. HY158]